MPLITKANRRVKKPAWQRGTKPPTKENKDALAITANHEQKFSRAFAALLRNLITPETLKQIRRAIKEGSTVEEMLYGMHFLDLDNPDTFALWSGFARKLERTYTLVIDETIQNENRKRGWKVETLKIEPPEMPINPSASQFVRAQSLTRVVDLSKQEKQRLRAILTANMETGFLISRPSAIVDEIADTVGLTAHQWDRVNKKVRKAREAGMSIAGVQELRRRESRKTRLQRARTIARTETNDALSQGLTESWKRAADGGLVPPGTMKRWQAMGDEVTSDICTDLDQHDPIPLNETFSTDEGGGWTGMGPPAHPNCRSTLVLVFPE